MVDYNNPTTIFDKADTGDSQIYVGIKYLGIVAQQIETIRNASRFAYNQKSNACLFWLNELRIFYDLIENRTDIHQSKEKIKLFEYVLQDNKLIKKEIEVKESEKYEYWFSEIEQMIERNSQVLDVNSNNPTTSKKYLNDKHILFELSRCMRELYRDANRKHLIMPEGMKDMKALAKSEWIDREQTKEF